MRNISAKQTQKIAMAGIWGGGVITLLLLIVIIGYVLIQGLPGINWEFLSTNPKGGLSGEGGILSTVVSTLYLIGITLVILVPLGIGSAVYLSEYAPNNRLTRIIRYGIETLAGIPSIIFGLFGYALFVTALSFKFSIYPGL